MGGMTTDSLQFLYLENSDRQVRRRLSDLVPGEEIPPEDQGCPNHIEPDLDETGTDVVRPDQLFVAPYLDEPDRGQW